MQQRKEKVIANTNKKWKTFKDTTKEVHIQFMVS
jgi:hypothetical protein